MTIKIQETQEYQRNRYELHKEINENKVEIDRSVFKKTEVEKVLLKKLKKAYKLSYHSR